MLVPLFLLRSILNLQGRKVDRNLEAFSVDHLTLERLPLLLRGPASQSSKSMSSPNPRCLFFYPCSTYLTYRVIVDSKFFVQADPRKRFVIKWLDWKSKLQSMSDQVDCHNSFNHISSTGHKVSHVHIVWGYTHYSHNLPIYRVTLSQVMLLS
ncbi:hypothetical protein LX36DRAFT_84185 [Colletotrichum falcatum]|nr:hypothetical protein LX36DRAFT_84185 [Colletotrichum falcatum]